MRQDFGLKAGVLVIVLLGGFAWVVTDNDFVGKSPDDEVVEHSVKRDSRSGKIYDEEVVRCKVCGEVISWTRFENGKAVDGNIVHNHNCNRYAKATGKASRLAVNERSFSLRHWLRLQLDKLFKHEKG